MSYSRRPLLFFVLLVSIFSFIILATFFSSPPALGSHGSSHRLSGYAWSSNIGWIKFNGGSKYGVELFGSALMGSAWSSNIGWIDFDPTGIPPSGSAGVSLDSSSGTLSGWARATSVLGFCPSEPSTGMKCNSQRGGWDGWISMSGTSPDYGVVYDEGGGEVSGYAWGSDVVGWIDFCSSPGTKACVTIDSLDVRCQTTDDNGVIHTSTMPFVLDNGSVDVNWESTVTPNGSYSYQWTWDNGDDPFMAQNTTQTYTAANTRIEGTITVTDVRNGPTGSAVCPITVEDPATPQLTVGVVGGSYGKVIADNPGSDQNPPDWTTVGCDSSCTSIYDVNEQVILTALPKLATEAVCQDPNTGADANCDFIGWSGDGAVNCPDSELTCTVDMDQSKNVIAEFRNLIQGEQEVNLTSEPMVLRINSHNQGQPAFTPSAIVTATVSGGGPALDGAQLCVDSFVSRLGQSVYDVISSNDDKVRCILGGNVSTCVDPNFGKQCAPLLPDENDNTLQTTFQILVPTRLSPDILGLGNPYFVTLSVEGEGLIGSLLLGFSYNAGGGGP